ncbi:hypothetical protein WN944_014429 [Citrus x changshan-huyou]|uniref:Uncharacterized protein n=1 Tax=Citrus x changshan-huyou TaxID=2935761 RepID=A0AAP0M9V0_9ROSI
MSWFWGGQKSPGQPMPDPQASARVSHMRAWTQAKKKPWEVGLDLDLANNFFTPLCLSEEQKLDWGDTFIMNTLPIHMRDTVDAEICSPLDRPDFFTNAYVIDCLLEPLGWESPSFLSLDLRSRKWVRDAGGFAGVNPPMPKLAQGLYGKTM